jgi:hypothetical protein
MSVDRKAAAAAWKERKVAAGVYAFRAPDGAVWVGATPTLDAAENRLRFTLRTGSCRVPALARAWQAAGGEGFDFEVLEALDPELGAMTRERLLKERLAHWRGDLGAEPL